MTDQNKLPFLIRFLLPKLSEIFFIAIFTALIGFGPRMMNIDGDLGRHITLGDYIITKQVIPTKDIFSHTKLGDPLTPHEWLSDVIFSLIHRIAGLNGIVFLTACVLGVAYWLVYQHSLNLSNMSVLSIIGTIVAAAASSLHWLTRPHIFTIFFVLIWTIQLEKMRLGISKRWIVFPLMMLIWVNLHGAFFAGIIIWGLYLLGVILDKRITWESVKPYLLVGISSLLITFLNPDGLGIYKTGFGFLGNKYLVSHTAEYLPPDFQQINTWPFLFLICTSLGLLAFSRKRLASPHVLLIISWTAMALYSTRNIPLYAISVVPILVFVASDIINDFHTSLIAKRFLDFQARIMGIEKELRQGFWSLVALVTTLGLLLSGNKLDFKKQGNIFLEEVFPVKAVSWMEDNMPRGNGFNYFPWGGYLLYSLWPEKLVFIDGQTDFYGEEVTRKYEQIITMQEGWEIELEQYSIQWVLVPTDSELGKILIEGNEWEEVYKDNTAILLERE